MTYSLDCANCIRKGSCPHKKLCPTWIGHVRRVKQDKRRYINAIIGSRVAIARYNRLRSALRFSWPVPAKGGFPYNRKSVAELDPYDA